MSDCCASQNKSDDTKQAAKLPCLNCDTFQRSVSYTTVVQHVVHTLNQSLDENGHYYFCSNSECDVVYFDTENQRFTRQDVRGTVGQKMTDSSRPICYCFDVSEQQALDEIVEKGFSSSKLFVQALTKSKHCACDVRNPSGKCCLADFPKAV